MESRYEASIVLIGPQVPSILDPDWLKNEQLISEEAMNFVNTSDISAFESESFSLVMDKERFQLIAKKNDTQFLDVLIIILKRYLAFFNNMEYKALGINFKWFVTYDDNDKIPEISFKIDEIDNIDQILPDHEIMVGTVIKAVSDDYQMNLTIDPSKKKLLYTFNFHHKLYKKSSDEIVKLLDNFMVLFNKAEEIVDITSGSVTNG